MKFPILFSIAAMAFVATTEAKPLKVFILAGQSNMEGHAESYTFPAIAKDPKTADLHKQMVDPDGKPVVCKDVWISYAYGDFGGNPIGRKSGNLTAGWGSQHHNICKIGPEFTFGITMQKHLGEPILLIKNARGGKSLLVDFRPPSAGEPTDPKHKDNAGKYYDHMMSHVKDVLADPKRSIRIMIRRRVMRLQVFSGSKASMTSWDLIPATRPRRASRTTPSIVVCWHVSSATSARISIHRRCLS